MEKLATSMCVSIKKNANFAPAQNLPGMKCGTPGTPDIYIHHSQINFSFFLKQKSDGPGKHYEIGIDFFQIASTFLRSERSWSNGVLACWSIG
jgi:hypothetical protein